MAEALGVFMRWLHISSVITLLGGMVFWRLAARAGEAGKALEESVAHRFRPLVFTAIAGLTLSGIYNVLSRPGHSPRYHTLLGIKLLLALHVFAVAALVVQPANDRRRRLMTGTLVSGFIIVAISAYLRRIF